MGKSQGASLALVERWLLSRDLFYQVSHIVIVRPLSKKNRVCFSPAREPSRISFLREPEKKRASHGEATGVLHVCPHMYFVWVSGHP